MAKGFTACAVPFGMRRRRDAAFRGTTGKPCAGKTHARFEKGVM